jgi:hypothetical protein
MLRHLDLCVHGGFSSTERGLSVLGFHLIPTNSLKCMLRPVENGVKE